ncbi:hypothetical protein HELRODRAFT_163510 [Helobdella robusta]|uniref:Reelin domain-containing protein n=1 Tax=Helobdella robusta TaxID=6412 RepID=T1EU56_HELRO|nr:hypothetical protein HELRODRAFT_163510 [Helobdella robusta]ESN96449.1 hypothetical protein HELRODRAFT_163510 [Helobdella robusta]
MKVLVLISIALLLQLMEMACFTKEPPTQTCMNANLYYVGMNLQDSKPPYKIIIHREKHNLYQVSLKSSKNFKGFIIEGFDSTENRVGKFTSLDENTKYLCGRTAVTNDAPIDISQAFLTWSPKNFIGKVIFRFRH